MWANQRVKLVKPDFDENKTKSDNLKVEIICVYNEYIKDNCKSKGEIQGNKDIRVLCTLIVDIENPKLEQRSLWSKQT